MSNWLSKLLWENHLEWLSICHEEELIHRERLCLRERSTNTMGDQKKRTFHWLESFASLRWYDEVIKFTFSFVTKRCRKASRTNNTHQLLNVPGDSLSPGFLRVGPLLGQLAPLFAGSLRSRGLFHRRSPLDVEMLIKHGLSLFFLLYFF